MTRPLLAPGRRTLLVFMLLASAGLRAADPLEGMPFLRAHVDTLDIHVAIQPGRAAPGLRSILLHNGQVLLEPHLFTLQDGARVMTTGDAAITAAEALALGAVLERHGFFAKAGKYYAELSAAPATPPPVNASKGLLPTLQGRGVAIYVNVNDADWHTTYQAAFDPEAGTALLDALAATATGEARMLLGELRAEMLAP